MTLTVAAPVWPVRVVSIRSAGSAVRWTAAEYRHHGIALRSQIGAFEALLDLAKEPGAVILVPTDLSDMPLLEFVELAVSLANAPVILGLVDVADDELIAACLARGARGVVTIPITPDRLAAALACIVRKESPEADILRCGQLTLDTGQHRVHYNGQEVSLALKEFRVLEHLMRIHPRVASVDEIARRFGSGNDRADPMPIRVAVRRLRLKLAATGSSNNPAVETVRGVGYRISA